MYRNTSQPQTNPAQQGDYVRVNSVGLTIYKTNIYKGSRPKPTDLQTKEPFAGYVRQVVDGVITVYYVNPNVTKIGASLQEYCVLVRREQLDVVTPLASVLSITPEMLLTAFGGQTGFWTVHTARNRDDRGSSSVIGVYEGPFEKVLEAVKPLRNFMDDNMCGRIEPLRVTHV